MRQTPVNDYLEEISTRLPEEIYGRLSDAIYETTCDFDEEVGLLKAENTKLRELVRLLLWGIDNDMPRHEELAWTQKVNVLVRELGVEVG